MMDAALLPQQPIAPSAKPTCKLLQGNLAASMTIKQYIERLCDCRGTLIITGLACACVYVRPEAARGRLPSSNCRASKGSALRANLPAATQGRAQQRLQWQAMRMCQHVILIHAGW
jgi:hypothetical protein